MNCCWEYIRFFVMLFGPVVYFLSRMVRCLQVHRCQSYLAWDFGNAIQCNDRTNKGTSFSRSIQTLSFVTSHSKRRQGSCGSNN